MKKTRKQGKTDAAEIQLQSKPRLTYFVTYHRFPLDLSWSMRFSTVTRWKFAAFSLRRKVSGIQISFQAPSPNRICAVFFR